MPIRPELRYLYKGPRWIEARAIVFDRAQGRCEKCNALQGTKYFSSRTGKLVIVQLGAAHLDHEDLERFYDPDNLRCLCCACHLRQDVLLHVTRSRATRQRTKDSQRPLLVGVAA
jgi:hypothetical protein